MLYVIAGNGPGNATEVQSSLKDVRDAAAKADQEFWVLLEGKEEPTKLDETIYKWLRTNEVWFEAVTSTGIVVDGAQEIGVSLPIEPTASCPVWAIGAIRNLRLSWV